jgi:hypothetical protein
LIFSVNLTPANTSTPPTLIATPTLSTEVFPNVRKFPYDLADFQCQNLPPANTLNNV